MTCQSVKMVTSKSSHLMFLSFQCSPRVLHSSGLCHVLLTLQMIHEDTMLMHFIRFWLQLQQQILQPMNENRTGSQPSRSLKPVKDGQGCCRGSPVRCLEARWRSWVDTVDQRGRGGQRRRMKTGSWSITWVRPVCWLSGPKMMTVHLNLEVKHMSSTNNQGGEETGKGRMGLSSRSWFKWWALSNFSFLCWLWGCI